MEIYADVIFMINLLMDIFILTVVNLFARQKSRFLRIFLGGLWMALSYCLLIFLVEMRVYLNMFASVVILMAGVAIAFHPQDIWNFLKLTGTAYITSFAVGGLGFALFYFTNISDVMGNMLGFTMRNFSFKILLASTCGFYLIIRLSVGWYRRRVIKRQVFYPVRIYYQGENISLIALLDTGNSLHDPISQAPVIIAEFNSVKKFLPDSLKLLFYEQQENNLEKLSVEAAEQGFSGRIRMIPYASLGKQNGLLLGFRPDWVEIMNERAVITLNEVIVGIYNSDLSGDGAYQGLLNPEVVQQRDSF